MKAHAGKHAAHAKPTPTIVKARPSPTMQPSSKATLLQYMFTVYPSHLRSLSVEALTFMKHFTDVVRQMIRAYRFDVPVETLLCDDDTVGRASPDILSVLVLRDVTPVDEKDGRERIAVHSVLRVALSIKHNTFEVTNVALATPRYCISMLSRTQLAAHTLIEMQHFGAHRAPSSRC